MLALLLAVGAAHAAELNMRVWVSVWWASREAHEANLAVVAKAYQTRPLPVFKSAEQPASESATP